MWHKPCRTFHPWCLCIKTRCLYDIFCRVCVDHTADQCSSDESEDVYASANHCSDVIMSAIASQITGVSNVCSNDCAGADQRKHQSSTSLAFVRGIGGFLLQWTSNAENVSIRWRHRGSICVSIKSSLKFVPKTTIDKKSAVVHGKCFGNKQ